MPIKRIMTKGKVPVKIYTDEIEHEALQQLHNISQLPIIHSHVAVRPDEHLGKGATVGSVIPTKGAIIPAAVGVDIGCGMNALRLSIKAKDLPDNLGKIRSAIEAVIPVGFDQHKLDRARASTISGLSRGLDEIIRKNPHFCRVYWIKWPPKSISSTTVFVPSRRRWAGSDDISNFMGVRRPSQMGVQEVERFLAHPGQ